MRRDFSHAASHAEGTSDDSLGHAFEQLGHQLGANTAAPVWTEDSDDGNVETLCSGFQEAAHAADKNVVIEG